MSIDLERVAASERLGAALDAENEAAWRVANMAKLGWFRSDHSAHGEFLAVVEAFAVAAAERAAAAAMTRAASGA